MRKTSIPAELRKARKVMRKGIVTSKRIAELPEIASREVLHSVDRWYRSAERDCYLDPKCRGRYAAEAIRSWFHASPLAPVFYGR